MRTRLLAVMVTALVLLAAPATAGPREDARDRRKAMQPSGGSRVAIIANGETRENLEQVVVNHFGNPDQGQVLIQTWVESDWTNFEAVDIQAAVQGVKIRRAAPGSPGESPSGSSCTTTTARRRTFTPARPR